MDNLKPLDALNVTGDVAENWRRWKQRWNLYSTASGASEKPESTQCAIFLHMIGEDALSVYDTFQIPTDEIDKVLPLIQRFDEHFAPQKNVTYQRYLFNTCTQDGRPFNEFLVDLKNKARTCEFGILENSLIRDRIICGLDDKTIRERLLRDNTLTLAKTMQHVRASETSKQHVNDLNASKYSTDYVSQTQSKQKSIDDQKSDVRSKVCYYCGTNHGRLCPAYGQKCSSCGRMNHFARVCQSTKNRKKLDNISCELQKEELFIDHISSNTISECNNELVATFLINNQPIQFKLDTGAQCNIIPQYVFDNLPSKPSLTKSNTILKTYDGSIVPLIGTCKMEIKSATKKSQAEFQIVAVSNVKPLLGLQTCKTMELFNIHTICSTTMRDANELLAKYENVFTGMGRVEGEFSIKLREDAQPCIHAPRKVPLSILPKLESTLNRLEQSNIVSKVTKPTDWVNSLVIVEKKDGSLRLCLDPKELNQYVMRDYRSVPSAEEISSKMCNKTVFTVIDMADCYWHIQLDAPSSELCTFNTPYGRYKFNRLPFGIACASDAAQNMVEKYFGHIPGVVAVHDDLIIAAENEKQHDKILEEVLQEASKNNIKFNKKKIQLKINEVRYLGHIIGVNGMRPDVEKVSAITDMPLPESKQDLQRFLGMINYLGKYIPNLSTITNPLRLLLKRETLWAWYDEHTQAIKTIKSILTSEPVLKFFDVKKPINIQVDASSHGLGGCLFQDGSPISYVSRS